MEAVKGLKFMEPIMASMADLQDLGAFVNKLYNQGFWAQGGVLVSEYFFLGVTVFFFVINKKIVLFCLLFLFNIGPYAVRMEREIKF